MFTVQNMKQVIHLIVLFCVFNLAAFAQTVQRYIAITIDDLPVVTIEDGLPVRQAITKKLLAKIKAAKIPAIGFVNENKLYTNGKLDDAKVDLLRQWLGDGLELGNHTFSHLSLNSNPLEKYEDEILKGETVTKQLLAAKNRQIRYFRHPYLMTGKTLETKQKLAAFLAAHGYKVAPVTYDNDDYVFARVYDVAKRNGDNKLREQVAAAYVPYLESKFDYWERQSVKLFGREPKQILLLHANSINADYFDKVAEMLKRRNYKFISLDEALKDDVYKLPDTWVNYAGISWLHRWAIEKGKAQVLRDEPDVPTFIMDVYKNQDTVKQD